MLPALADASKQDEHTESVSRSRDTHIIAQPKFFEADSDFLSFGIRLADLQPAPRHFSVSQVGSFPRTIDTHLFSLAMDDEGCPHRLDVFDKFDAWPAPHHLFEHHAEP